MMVHSKETKVRAQTVPLANYVLAVGLYVFAVVLNYLVLKP